MIAFCPMTPETLATTVESIETKIAFLERANAELSDVVYRQKKELDELRSRIAGLSARLDAAQEEAGQPYTLDQEKPPHY
jgi:SlyX protein